MKIMLVFPPRFDATMPNLGLACLAAVLRKAGHEVIMKDVNVESYNHFLTKFELKRAYDLINERHKYFAFSGVTPEEFNRLINKKDELFENVEKAKNVLRDKEDFYDFEKYTRSIRLINDSLKFISLAYYRTELSIDYYKTIYSQDSTSQIIEAANDDICNLYIDYFTRYTLPDIVRSSPNIIGISITTSNQMIPSLTLAHMLKKELKELHIVAGGNQITCLKDKLSGNNDFFKFVDSVVIHEGETAILELVKNLEQGTSLENVPNLIFRNKEGKVIINDKICIEDINKLPTPDFNGLPLDAYLSPELLIPVYASRGCYWGKCAFCNFHKTSGIVYRARNEKLVIEDMKKLSSESNSNNFCFVDEAIPPVRLRNLANQLQEKNINLNWLSFARFEKQLDEELCKKIANSGCRMLVFGLESACNRVLKSMHKGTNTKIMKDTLINSSKSKITNHVSFILGFPGESPSETMETINFITENADYISSMISSCFSLADNSYIFDNKDEYGITVITHENHDLAFRFDYNAASGVTQQSALNANIKFIEKMSELNYPFYTGIFFNYHVFLFSKNYKTNNVFGFFEKTFNINREKVISDLKNCIEKALDSSTLNSHNDNYECLTNL